MFLIKMRANTNASLLIINCTDRKKCPKEKDWGLKHHKWIEMWNKREELVGKDGTVSRDSDYVAQGGLPLGSEDAIPTKRT
jgi:hypothetical protein